MSYVKAIIEDLVDDCRNLKKEGINSIAIMSNDTKNYPEDSFEKMIEFSKINKFGDLYYCIDETQKLQKNMVRCALLIFLDTIKFGTSIQRKNKRTQKFKTN